MKIKKNKEEGQKKAELDDIELALFDQAKKPLIKKDQEDEEVECTMIDDVEESPLVIANQGADEDAEEKLKVTMID